MNNIPLLVLFFCATSCFAQFEKIIHQSFELEERSDIKFDIHGEYEIEPWAGNVVLTETKVQLYDASPSIFNFYLEKERYNLNGEQKNTTYTVQSVDKERKPIRTKKGECYEFVKIRVFIPEEYVKIGNNHWKFNTEEEIPVADLKGDEGQE